MRIARVCWVVRRRARFGALAMGLGLGGCGRTEPRRLDTMAIVSKQSRDALALRQECQNALDSARAAFVRREFDACITSLIDAARFFRDQSRTDAAEVRPTLLAAADELETLAANVAYRRPRTVRDFDRAFARAHAAETVQHLAHARTAFPKNDNVRAGEELFMSVDHLERAAKYARMRNDRRVRTAVADARTLAGEMIRRMNPVPDEASKVIAEVENAVGLVVESVYVPPGPAPLPRER